jgi:putative YphP/YqiW family bacilliredoxin
MPYPEEWVRPGREELTQLGFTELRTENEVEENLGAGDGSVLLVVNSICGCAAGRARPAVADALASAPKPDKITTVFAGQDLEATAKAREYLRPFPPSSPSIALLKDGKLVFMLERHQIEGREAPEISADLKAALQEYCKQPS